MREKEKETAKIPTLPDTKSAGRQRSKKTIVPAPPQGLIPHRPTSPSATELAQGLENHGRPRRLRADDDANSRGDLLLRVTNESNSRDAAPDNTEPRDSKYQAYTSTFNSAHNSNAISIPNPTASSAVSSNFNFGPAANASGSVKKRKVKSSLSAQFIPFIILFFFFVFF